MRNASCKIQPFHVPEVATGRENAKNTCNLVVFHNFSANTKTQYSILLNKKASLARGLSPAASCASA
jgi:hypothetical protein